MKLLEGRYPGEWRFVGDGTLILGKMCPDFVHISRNLIIEAFGCYWHSPQDEPIRAKYFADRGYRTLILWEDDSDKVMMKKIGRFIKEDDFSRGVR